MTVIPASFPVYHGSYTHIEQVDFSMCRGHRDFGRGFYVSKFRQHAETWARNLCRKRRRQEQAAITEFVYHDNSFTQHICKKKFFGCYNEEWTKTPCCTKNRGKKFMSC